MTVTSQIEIVTSVDIP